MWGMEEQSPISWAAMPEQLVSGFSLAVLEQIAKILDSAEESKPDTQGLQENIESLREEKEYWKSFMEAEEWNRDTVREVETAWRKRSQGDPFQPTVKPSLEQLVDNVKEPVEKPPPHARPLRRSHTDPTDLLWVFRRRASLLEQRVQQNFASSQSNECNEPYPGDASRYQTKEGLNESAVDKARSSRSESPSSQDSHPKEFATEERARESSSDSETREDTPYEWTAMPLKHHDEPRRKISAPAYRPGRRDSLVAVHTNRRASVAAPRRFNRRGSEAPALTVIARRRNSQSLAYPVGLRRRHSRAAGLDNQLRVQAKAKHEMLANLVLPAFVDELPRTRERRIERRNTFTFQAPSMRTKKDEKRYQVAKEILETEKKYLSCLRTLKEVFEEPMRESNFIPSKEIDVLFPGELVHILTSHTHFMKDLEERLQNWKLQGIVGDLFTKLSGSYHIDVLRIYSNYVNNFPKAISVINKSSRGSQKFRKFLQNCSSKSECEGLDLPAFLLTPIQRLPRYVLLLRQLSKYTDAGHPDSFHIENALETMKQMINILNDSIQSSCKLANNSQFRRSFKRKSLKKKGKELQKNIQSFQDNDRGSVGASSVSTLSIDSAGPSNPCSQDGSPERITSQAVISEEKESLTLSRPASIGDKETYYERDSHEEFAAIEEEDSDDVKDNKNSGQSMFRVAAGNLIRNWQRRSKKWRRSTEEPLKQESQGEMDTLSKENDYSQDCMEETRTVISQENTEDENGNVKRDVTPPCSPSSKCLRKNAVTSPSRPRPVSLGYLSTLQLKEHENNMKDKVLSDPSLIKEKNGSLEHSSDIWIPRQQFLLSRRRQSDNARHSVCSRTSSVVSGGSSPLSGSRKSLSRISQESLADSGVSETPGSSPSNTLNSRTRKASSDKRNKLSHSLTNVSGTSEPKRKLSQLNRRSWGDWVSAEMENTPDEGSVEIDNHVDDVSVKHKRKFKDVMKQFFSPKKKSGQSSSSCSGETTENVHCAAKKSPKPTKTEIGEKISTV